MPKNEITIRLRPAVLDDASQLYEWRNADETRRFFLDPSPIVRERHDEWLQEVLARKDRHLLIGETPDGPAGVLRFDLLRDAAEVSLYVVPGLSGKGVGTALLKEALVWARQELPHIRRLRARIHPDNLASQRLFGRMGFKEILREYELDLTTKKVIAR